MGKFTAIVLRAWPVNYIEIRMHGELKNNVNNRIILIYAPILSKYLIYAIKIHCTLQAKKTMKHPIGTKH